VRWGFDPRRLLVWLDRPGDDGSIDHGLCNTHAQRLRPPRGWWLDDRRLAQPALFPDFTADSETPDAADPRRPARPAEEESDPADDERSDDGSGAVARGKGRRRKRREAARQRAQAAQAGTDEPLPFTPDSGAP
jgi:hypothetical protein